jgi:thiol-disulfide isomerase/thioredoxin
MKFIHISSKNAGLFDSLVQKSPAFVKFYKNGCGHCDAMEDAWNTLKRDIKPYKNVDINVISVNADAINDIKSNSAKNISGFPTIMEVVPGGDKGAEHMGERTTKELMKSIEKIIKNYNKKGNGGIIHRTNNQQSSPQPVGRREIMKKAKIWAQFLDNMSAEAEHPVDLSSSDNELLHQEASYLRSLRDMPESVRNELTIDLTNADGIKSNKKRRKRTQKKNRRSKKRRYKRGSRRYSRIRR